MTREDTAECIKVIIRRRKTDADADTDTENWIDIESSIWDWDNYDYRIKPEPSYRPFRNAEECWQEMLKHQPFGIMSSKNRKDYMSFMSLNDEGCDFCGYEGESFESAFDDIQFADGAPFGIKKEQ